MSSSWLGPESWSQRSHSGRRISMQVKCLHHGWVQNLGVRDLTLEEGSPCRSNVFIMAGSRILGSEISLWKKDLHAGQMSSSWLGPESWGQRCSPSGWNISLLVTDLWVKTALCGKIVCKPGCQFSVFHVVQVTNFYFRPHTHLLEKKEKKRKDLNKTIKMSIWNRNVYVFVNTKTYNLPFKTKFGGFSIYFWNYICLCITHFFHHATCWVCSFK